MEDKTVTPVDVGDPVRIVDETYGEHVGLVTVVHGTFSGDHVASSGYVPCINVVYVSGDPDKRDPYGRQVERMSSLQHYSAGPAHMPRPGRYWINM